MAITISHSVVKRLIASGVPMAKILRFDRKNPPLPDPVKELRKAFTPDQLAAIAAELEAEADDENRG